MKLRWSLDPLAIIILVCLSINTAYHFLSTEEGQKGSFYQSRFASAVMQACGHGYTLPTKTIPSLEQFLIQKAQHFDCQDISADIQFISINQDIFLIEQHYLLSAVALVWRIVGVDWHNVIYLNILFYTLTIIGAYSVFRLGMNPIFAFLASFLLLKSHLHLTYLPHLRDYSVAPFTIWFTWLIGLMVVKARSFLSYSILTLLIGVLLGIAIGCRSDSFVFIPFFFMTILFFLPQKASLTWVHKLCLIILFNVIFGIIALPILLPMLHTGSVVAPMILEGLMEPFTIHLGLNSSTLYSIGGVYSDSYADLLIRDYGHRILHETNPSLLQYDHMSKAVLFEWARHFPGDLVSRWYASVNSILQPRLSMPDSGIIIWLKSDFLSQYSIYFTLATLTILAYTQLRLALFGLFFVLFFAGYPVLQFDFRHYFYLEFISLWCVGFIFQIFWLLCSKIIHARRVDRCVLFSRFKVVFLFWLTVLLSATVLLWAARLYQTYHLRVWFKQYLQAKTNSVITSDVVNDDLTLVKLLAPTKDKIYLKVALSPKCSNKVIKLRFKFNPSSTGNFTTDLLVNNYGRHANILFPVYSMELFQGVEIKTEDRHCIQAIQEIQLSEKITLLPILWLPEDWQDKRLYSIFQRNRLDLISPISFKN